MREGQRDSDTADEGTPRSQRHVLLASNAGRGTEHSRSLDRMPDRGFGTTPIGSALTSRSMEWATTIPACSFSELPTSLGN